MSVRAWIAAAGAALVAGLAGLSAAAPAGAANVAPRGAAPAGSASFTGHERAVLYGIARDTWRFYAADVDPTTHLPLDNLGPGAVRGAYTSGANIGVTCGRSSPPAICT